MCCPVAWYDVIHMRPVQFRSSVCMIVFVCLCMCVCMYDCVCVVCVYSVCMCVCVCVYSYLCVCGLYVYVCVCRIIPRCNEQKLQNKVSVFHHPTLPPPPLPAGTSMLQHAQRHVPRHAHSRRDNKEQLKSNSRLAHC